MISSRDVLSELNAKVTTAIMAAEEVTYQAIAAWDAVKQVEELIAAHPDASELEKAIANRGAGMSGKHIDVMSALIGKHAGKWALERAALTAGSHGAKR